MPTPLGSFVSRESSVVTHWKTNGPLASTLQCHFCLYSISTMKVKKPEGYLYLFVDGVGCVKVDTIDGVVTSMRSYLTPDSEEYSSSYSEWLADVDGTYGENPDGIFYFDKNGEYHEWTGLYYYSEHYYKIDDPMLREIAGEFEAG